ncbi:MAG: hypothetical protein K2W95_15235 [Candidatus Obscuribacterales bacterium]|nr:hypothetical protein [Candidatus Obscuribacterales bacterium]
MLWLSEFWSDDGGQGITEYACILAFVSLLIASVFAIAQGSFSDSLFASFSSMSREIGRLCETASGP